MTSNKLLEQGRLLKEYKKGHCKGGVLLIFFGLVLNIEGAKFHVGCKLNLIITTNHGFIYNIDN